MTWHDGYRGPWTEEHWNRFCGFVAHGWRKPGEFTQADADAMWIALQDTDPDVCLQAATALMHAGLKWRPDASDIIAALGRQETAGQPTFEEAERLIFGRGGILKARPGQRTFTDVGEQARAVEAAQRERMAETHSLVAEFVRRMGLAYLARLPIAGGDEEAKWARKDLRDAWDRHVEAFAGREVAALAAGRDRREGLRRLDPLVVLGHGERRELEAGGTS